MKKFLLPALLSAMFVAGTSAEVKVTVTPLGERPTTLVRKVVSTADILVRQDFSELTAPYIETPIPSAYIPQDNPNTPLENPVTGAIPAEFMGNQEGWRGNYVFSDDGACVIQTHGAGAQEPSYLRTPINDYSGSLTVTFIAKALPTYWYVYNEEGEEQRQSYTGSSIMVGMYTESDREPEIPGSYPFLLADVRMYPNQGWCEVKIEVDNLSAYNDAFLQFATGEIVAIDDIKVTTSVDNFIAAPVLESVTDVTDTSFTINLEPVRKSFNYYVYLYTLTGYNENGEPIFQPVLSPEDRETIEILAEYYGMTVEEYWQAYLEEWDINEPYDYYGIIDKGTSYTFTDLDPAVQYYFGVRSHFVNKFSDLAIYEQTILPTPVTFEPVKLSSDSFKAEWKPVAKAEEYCVTLYGVGYATATNNEYCIFEDIFENAIGKPSIDSPEELDPYDDNALNPYTDMPGWRVYYGQPLVADGCIGMRGYGGSVIVTPDLYLKGTDTVTINARVVSNDPYAGGFYLACGYRSYVICEFTNGVWEGEVTFPTEGADWGYIQFVDMEGIDLFVDYISVTRNVEKDEPLYTYLKEDYVDNDTSIIYSDLNTNMFTTFGYDVVAINGIGEDMRTSARSEILTINMSNGGSNVTSITNAADNEIGIEAIYTTTGQKVEQPVKGINIIRYTNGTTKKVIIK